MATTLPYSDQTETPSYSAVRVDVVEHRQRDVGATVFVWLAIALALAFWAANLTALFGILGALGHPAADGLDAGEADVGGLGWMTINFVGGLLILGGALAYGAYRYASRDKRLDPMTEASTAALYDNIERQGGDDTSSRSPEDRSPMERDAYRTSQSDLR
ncbi:hypothetical protein [Phenylobacterium sp.]|jgi:hypothetical protein|uniref:hypothetical protein n=1 Tax=Phenylobacterium sp. TaxID=1871053 RepID=UPI002F92279D